MTALIHANHKTYHKVQCNLPLQIIMTKLVKVSTDNIDHSYCTVQDMLSYYYYNKRDLLSVMFDLINLKAWSKGKMRSLDRA